MTDHDDEERREKCECDEPGSSDWWRSPAFVLQGPADTILRLLEQGEISRKKALELLAHLQSATPFDYRRCPPPAPPSAPWDKLNWCDDPPAGVGLTVREACRRRVPLDGTDAQALEHALYITERERDDALDGVAAGKRAAQAWRELVNELNEINRMCGGDEDVPRKAVERVLKERDFLRGIEGDGGK